MPPPKHTKHDWSDKRDVCYRLWVEEERSMPDILEYFSSVLGVPQDKLPSKTNFTRRFREWGFPRRWELMKPDEEAKIVERIRQLWELSYSNGEIHVLLQNEGWDVTDRKVSALRRKHGFNLRESDHKWEEAAPQNVNEQPTEASTAPVTHQYQQQPNNNENGSVYPHQQQQFASMPNGDFPFPVQPFSDAAQPIANPANTGKRPQELLEESEELLQAKKRRRRIRGRGPLPPDAPGMPPRYKSETSLNECKAYLQLDNELYLAVRQHFMDICNEMGIVKKTKCLPGQWEESKDRLIRENEHINTIMHTPHPNANELANALEVLCADVTKRIRVMDTRVSIQDANNGLHLNPADSKHLRHLFYQICVQEGYTTRMECSDEQWGRMMRTWFSQSDILMRLEQQGMNDQERKFLHILARDAVKRYNSFKAKNDPNSRHWTEGSYGPGPPAARGKPTKKKEPKAPKTPRNRGTASLDPALAQFAAKPPPPPPMPLPIEAIFQLAPESRLVGYHPKLWPSKLEVCSIAGLHKAGTVKTGAAQVGSVYGILMAAGQTAQRETAGGDEEMYLIESDEDLVGYLEKAKELANENVVFLMELSGGYA